MTTKKIIIYGPGGFGREAAWLIQNCKSNNDTIEIVGFIDDNLDTHGSSLNEIPIMGLSEAHAKFSDAKIVCGIGAPAIREKLMQKAKELGFESQYFIHQNVEISKWVTVGEGSLICAGNIITTNIAIGEHVHLNLDCTVGHDVIIGDYSTISPGVHISGYVQMGKRVFIGTGANILNGTKETPLIIEDDAVVGAGACVTKSVASGTTVVGIPAKPLQERR